VDIAIINGNYAILGGLKVADALTAEKADSIAAVTYANVVAIREGDENRPELQALIKALKSDKVKEFMIEKYEGAVVPAN
jgi:D-methionine transport system substrate-binding protein